MGELDLTPEMKISHLLLNQIIVLISFLVQILFNHPAALYHFSLRYYNAAHPLVRIHSIRGRCGSYIGPESSVCERTDGPRCSVK